MKKLAHMKACVKEADELLGSAWCAAEDLVQLSASGGFRGEERVAQGADPRALKCEEASYTELMDKLDKVFVNIIGDLPTLIRDAPVD